jgi:hypothetical protein
MDSSTYFTPINNITSEDDLDDLPDLISLPDLMPGDLMPCDRMHCELVSLPSDLMPCKQVSDIFPTKNVETLQEIKDNIEASVNFSSLNESMHAINNPDILLNQMQTAFDQFKTKVGRNMTYSEMREMMG